MYILSNDTDYLSRLSFGIYLNKNIMLIVAKWAICMWSVSNIWISQGRIQGGRGLVGPGTRASHKEGASHQFAAGALFNLCSCPANTRHWPNVCLMLGQRRRRWTNNKLTLAWRLMFVGCLITYPVQLAVKWQYGMYGVVTPPIRWCECRCLASYTHEQARLIRRGV